MFFNLKILGDVKMKSSFARRAAVVAALLCCVLLAACGGTFTPRVEGFSAPAGYADYAVPEDTDTLLGTPLALNGTIDTVFYDNNTVFATLSTLDGEWLIVFGSSTFVDTDALLNFDLTGENVEIYGYYSGISYQFDNEGAPVCILSDAPSCFYIQNSNTTHYIDEFAWPDGQAPAALVTLEVFESTFNALAAELNTTFTVGDITEIGENAYNANLGMGSSVSFVLNSDGEILQYAFYTDIAPGEAGQHNFLTVLLLTLRCTLPNVPDKDLEDLLVLLLGGEVYDKNGAHMYCTLDETGRFYLLARFY